MEVTIEKKLSGFKQIALEKVVSLNIKKNQIFNYKNYNYNFSWKTFFWLESSEQKIWW